MLNDFQGVLQNTKDVPKKIYSPGIPWIICGSSKIYFRLINGPKRYAPIRFGPNKEKEEEYPYSRLLNEIHENLEKHGVVLLISPYSEEEICIPICESSKDPVCTCYCTCSGEHHGKQHGGGYKVTDRYTVEHNSYLYSCKVIRRLEVVTLSEVRRHFTNVIPCVVLHVVVRLK